MTKKKKREISDFVISELSQLYPYAKIQLDFRTPYELLIATILSAQCTDERVNNVTSTLFKNNFLPEHFVSMTNEQLEKLIFSTGYYKAKAKNIKEMSKLLLDKYDGIVPGTMEELLILPGVGRKTANVILGHVFNIQAIVVDTHVTRIVNKLGLCNTKDAVKIEFELMSLVQKDKWVIFTHYLINFGRNICIARRPKCSICPLNRICPSAEN